MADSREIGMRVGAATNQAVSVAVQLIADGQLGADPKEVATYAEQLAIELLEVMDGLQTAALGAGVEKAVSAAFAGTTVVPTPAVATVLAAAAASDHTPSGSSKPLGLDHPSLPAWAAAQAQAVGVTQLWDNRGKPNYIAAIAAGAAKIPPPFRSATEGIDKSFWPPKK
jgi:hypothetical protein